MTNMELERRLANALSRTAPNDIEGVLSRCETRKGNVIRMTTRRKNSVRRSLIAACLALALIGGGGGMIYQQAYAVTSVISLDVNPSIELKVNKNEKVLDCEALNTEAKTVLADMNGGADLKGTKVDVAVNAIIGALMRSGYLDSISSAILISVEDGDQTRAARLQRELTTEVDAALQAQSSEAAILSQAVKKDATLEKWAKENHISTGKASLITRIMELNDELAFEKLSALSVEELKDLLDTRAPGMPIGRDAAVSAARQYAGVSDVDAIRWEVDAELDDVPACYEVDLYVSGTEVEYTVDAYTGKVLRGTPVPTVKEQSEKSSAPAAPAKEQSGEKPAKEKTTGGTTASEQGDIGRDKAKSIALAHAGLTESQVTRLQVEKDRDDGRTVSEIEFQAGNMEYEYTIDAAAGDVLECEKDRDD